MCFGHTEGPGAAFGVTGVLPDGFDIFFEEAVGVPEREGDEGGVVEDLPEGLNGTDTCNLLQLIFIVIICARGVCRGAIMPKGPFMAERKRPEGLEHIHAELGSFPRDGTRCSH